MAAMLLLILIYLSYVCLGIQGSLLGAAWPAMYSSLSLPVSFIGTLSLVITGSTIISSIFCEKALKRLNTGMVIGTGFLMIVAALSGLSISNGSIMLCLFSIPLGLGIGLEEVALNDFIARHYKAKHMNWLHCFWGGGATIGPVILAFCLMHIGSWNSGYLVIGAVMACFVVCVFLSLPLWKNFTGTQAKEAGASPSKFSQLLKIPRVKYALALFFIYTGFEAVIILWGSSYLSIVKNISAETAAYWMAVFFFGLTFGRFVSGFLTLKLNSRLIIHLGLTVIAVGGTLLFMSTASALLQISFFMLGLGCAPVFPTLAYETPANFGMEHSQAIMGLEIAFAYSGAALMPLLFGGIASKWGYEILPVFIGFMLIIVTILVENLHKKIEKVSCVLN